MGELPWDPPVGTRGGGRSRERGGREGERDREKERKGEENERVRIRYETDWQLHNTWLITVYM